jgi:hypothetical protein
MIIHGEQVLTALDAAGHIRTSEVALLLGVSRPRAQQILASPVADGHLERSGWARAALYLRPGQPRPDDQQDLRAAPARDTIPAHVQRLAIEVDRLGIQARVITCGWHNSPRIRATAPDGGTAWIDSIADAELLARDLEASDVHGTMAA